MRAQRDRYEGLQPATREAEQGPIARWIRGGQDALAAEEREQFDEGEDWRSEQIAGAGASVVVRAPRSPQAATQSDDSSGQEAVEEEIPPRIIDTLTYFGGVARMSQHIMTGTGGDYRVMQMDADGQEGEILGSQDTAVSALDVPDIGVITFGSKTYSSRPIILTREMIQDSVFDIQRYVERQALAAHRAHLQQGVHCHTERHRAARGNRDRRLGWRDCRWHGRHCLDGDCGSGLHRQPRLS